ncbi:Protein spotted leaf 11 [Diplonema papillatum]|nr:Protein spotted leaf 11 [Diplonema papillatum]
MKVVVICLVSASLGWAMLHGSQARVSGLYGSQTRESALRGSQARVSAFHGSQARESTLHGSQVSTLYGSQARESTLHGSQVSTLYGSQARESTLYGSQARESTLHGSQVSTLYGSQARESTLHGSQVSTLYGSQARESTLHGSQVSTLYGSQARASTLYGSQARVSTLYGSQPGVSALHSSQARESAAAAPRADVASAPREARRARVLDGGDSPQSGDDKAFPGYVVYAGMAVLGAIFCFSAYKLKTYSNARRGGEVQPAYDDELEDMREVSYPDAPDRFLCPITLDVMRNPVVCVDRHHTFEKAAIQRCLVEGNPECPVSRVGMALSDLAPDPALRAEIKAWLAARHHNPPPATGLLVAAHVAVCMQPAPGQGGNSSSSAASSSNRSSSCSSLGTVVELLENPASTTSNPAAAGSSASGSTSRSCSSIGSVVELDIDDAPQYILAVDAPVERFDRRDTLFDGVSSRGWTSPGIFSLPRSCDSRSGFPDELSSSLLRGADSPSAGSVGSRKNGNGEWFAV